MYFDAKNASYLEVALLIHRVEYPQYSEYNENGPIDTKVYCGGEI